MIQAKLRIGTWFLTAILIILYGSGCASGHKSLFELAVEAHAQSTPELDRTGKDGLARLHKCALNSDLEGARDLIARGAEVDVRATKNWKYRVYRGDTPLHCAIENKDAEMVRLLLENGADPSARSESRDSPMCWATFSHSLAAGSKYRDEAEIESLEEIMATLVQYGANVHIGDSFSTPLLRAIKEDDLFAVRFLLEHGARVSLGVVWDETEIEEHPYIVESFKHSSGEHRLGHYRHGLTMSLDRCGEEIRALVEDAYWAESAHSVGLLETYTSIFGLRAKYADQVAARIESIRWADATQSDLMEDYIGFAADFPASSHLELATERITGGVAAMLQAAEASGELADYQAVVDVPFETPYHVVARRHIERAALDRALASESLEDVVGFIREYPASEFTGEAAAVLLSALPGDAAVRRLSKGLLACAQVAQERDLGEEISVRVGSSLLAWDDIPSVYASSANEGMVGISLGAFSPAGLVGTTGTGTLVGSRRYCHPGLMRLHLRDWVTFDGHEAKGTAVISEDGLVFQDGSILIRRR